VSGLTGEAEDRQISGYTRRSNKEKGQVVADDSNGQVTELIESTIRSRHITMCRSGSEKLYHSICGQNYCNTKVHYVL
jgi:hypothetical protein